MSAANNKKRFLYSIIRKLCFVIILSLSLMIAGCAEVLAVGAVVLAAAAIEDATKPPPKPAAPVIRAYAPPEQKITKVEPPKEPDYQSMRDQAVHAYQDLNWGKSESAFKELANSNAPEHIQVESFIFLGAISYQNGDTYSAENYFRQAKNISLTIFPSEEIFPPEMIKFYKSVKR